MKKLLCALLILTLLLALTACDKAPGASKGAPPASWPSDTSPTPDTPTSSTPTPTPDPTPEPKPDPEPEPTSPEPVPEPEPGLQYADLEGLVFYFASGAGAWSTEVHILPDGTFTGYYHDSDMGDMGDGYPEGTMYVCQFSGKFSPLEKISDFEYTMRCIELTAEGTPGDEEIVDGLRIVTSTPYGFDSADEFRLYLPGRATGDLPEQFLDWVRMPRSIDLDGFDTLDFYGLYNVGGEQGFSA